MSPTIPASLRNWVREHDAGRCAYCHSPENMSITPFELDHIVPLSSGGRTEPGNLCLCCPTCNRFKGARQHAVDPATGGDAPLFHPRVQIWSDHIRLSEDGATIMGLTPTGRATVATLQMNRPSLVQLRKLWRKLGLSL